MAIKKRPQAPVVTSSTRWAGHEGYKPGQPREDVTIDCTGKKFEDALRKAVDNDADEILVRIASYGPSLEPGEFQAIVRFSDRTRPWSVVIHRDPFQALAQAVLKAAGMSGPTMQQRHNEHGQPKNSQDSARLLRQGSQRRIKRLPRKP